MNPRNYEITYIAIIERKGNWTGKEGKGFHQAVYIKAGGKHYMAHFSTDDITNRQAVFFEISGPITRDNKTKFNGNWEIIDDSNCDTGTTIGQILRIQYNTSWTLDNNCASFARKAYEMASGHPIKALQECGEMLSRAYNMNVGLK